MRQLWTVVRKEILDNLRDKRSLFSALLYGPVLMPLLMVGPVLFGISQYSIDFEEPKTISVIGMERAPNLIRYLRANNLDAEAAPASYRERIADGTLNTVLEIPEPYGDSLSAGRPAELVIHYSETRDKSTTEKRQLTTVLGRYEDRIRSQRYLARGIDERLFDPLSLLENDLSDEPAEVRFMGQILLFVLIFSMMMGGFYLAVDSTAGERERHSLEPLLTLPLARSTLVTGKYLAVLFFVVVSLVLPLISSYLLLGFLPEDLFGGTLDFGYTTFVTGFVISAPLAVTIASFLIAIAALARNAKEAQTHLSLAMMLPLVPFFALQYLTIPEGVLTMTLPMLSQYSLMEQVVVGLPVPGLELALSAIGSLSLAAVLFAATLWLYSRERILL